MYKINKILFILFALVYMNVSFALDKQNKLTLTLINHSKLTLSFSGVSGQNPSNVFKVTPQILFPGNTAIIEGETSDQYDLAANLHFKDNTGDDNILTIIDYRQFHVGQSIFSMMTPNLSSSIVSRTLNPKIEPRALMYSAVTLSVIEQSKSTS